MTDIVIIVLLAVLIVLSIGIVIAVSILIRKNKSKESDIDLDEFIEVVQGYSQQMKEHLENNRNYTSEHINTVIDISNNMLSSNINELAKVERDNADSLRQQLHIQLTDTRNTVNKSLTDIKQDNNIQLNNIRQIVDKTLVDALEEKLNKSYGIISERLEAVAKGFGEMQKLTSGVSDLQKVLSNVKTRGIWGEVMLGTLLEQMLAPEQFSSQCTIDGGEQVDFGVILPGKNNDSMILPIDAKFPDASYQRLIEADNPTDYGVAVKSLVQDLKKQAKSISSKYIRPPKTTDFAIMYLPTEGLFSEAVKRDGLMEELQNNYRIMIAGPTTISALLNSLQMGFKTLAIEKRSIEIRDLLITFRREFVKFASILERTQVRLTSVSKSLEDATKKTRTISRKLTAVESLTDSTDNILLDEETE